MCLSPLSSALSLSVSPTLLSLPFSSGDDRLKQVVINPVCSPWGLYKQTDGGSLQERANTLSNHTLGRKQRSTEVRKGGVRGASDGAITEEEDEGLIGECEKEGQKDEKKRPLPGKDLVLVDIKASSALGWH